MEDEKLVSIAKAKEYLGLKSDQQVYNLIERKEIFARRWKSKTRKATCYEIPAAGFYETLLRKRNESLAKFEHFNNAVHTFDDWMNGRTS